MMGEHDLNPLGFHRHPPGRRMPSMMSPTVVLRDGAPVLAVGSAGSNRIRSAILQTIIRSIDDGLPAQAAIDAPRVHYEDGVVYCEPGIDVGSLTDAGRTISPFRERNLFFGGAQAVARDPERPLLRRRRPAAGRRGHGRAGRVRRPPRRSADGDRGGGRGGGGAWLPSWPAAASTSARPTCSC